MEVRVKTAIEAEALSQRRLAAAEAEIADLREKCESSERLGIVLWKSLQNFLFIYFPFIQTCMNL